MEMKVQKLNSNKLETKTGEGEEIFANIPTARGTRTRSDSERSGDRTAGVTEVQKIIVIGSKYDQDDLLIAVDETTREWPY
jgi:hypothetical protein